MADAGIDADTLLLNFKYVWLRCSNLAGTDCKEGEGMLDQVDFWSDPAQSFLCSSETISDQIQDNI